MGNAVSAQEHSVIEPDSTAMLIYSAEKTSEDVYKLSTSLGSFFLRAVYLNDETEEVPQKIPHAQLIKASELNSCSPDAPAGTEALPARTKYIIDFDDLEPNTQVSSEISEKILDAALAFSAEHAAVSYLERAEHSTELLRRKLKQKGHSDAAIQKALEYAQKRNWLSDERYAGAFLRNRSIRKAEGRTRLLAELAARGISRDTAEKAVEEFFAQKSEASLLEKAAGKLKNQGKTKEQAQQALIRLGFSWSDIKFYIKNNWI